MPTIPVRDLGKIGIFPDANPYDLPINAFSDGANILFDEGKVQRAPVFKTLYSALKSNQAYSANTDTFDASTATYENSLAAASSTRFVSYYNATQEVVLVCDTDGTVREYPNGVMGVVTPGVTLVTNDEPWTHTQVAGLSVLARRGMVPYIRNLRSDAIYSAFGGDWVSTHTCTVARGFLDFIICMNVTKGSVENGTMVKWCNPLTFSQATSTINWDPANTTYLAGENILGDMRTPILDGLPLHNTFVIYSSDQVWTMEYTQGASVFSFKRLFSSAGILNTNCVTEVEGKHYVFGVDDIYVHDGIAKKSIADERVRRKIFQSLQRDKKNKAFVHHDSVLNLVYFCYVDLNSTVGFPATNYCNRAAVYNYRNDTWSFMDLPNIVGAAEASISLVSNNYEAFPKSYDQFSNIYSGFEDTTPRVSLMLGNSDTTNGITDSRVYAVDLPTIGLVPLAIEAETLKDPYVERIGIDLDREINAPLRSYKMVKSIQPQVDSPTNTGNVVFQFGGQDNPNQAVNWQDPVTFDHLNDYKVDTRASGRYLAIRTYLPKREFFRWTAYDVDVEVIGKR